MSTAKKKRIRVAFWGYDTFPYLLSGIIGGPPEHYNGKTYYKIPSFGGGMSFCPLFIVAGKKGVDLAAKLEDLRAKHRAARNRLTEKYSAKRMTLLAEYGIKPSTLNKKKNESR